MAVVATNVRRRVERMIFAGARRKPHDREPRSYSSRRTATRLCTYHAARGPARTTPSRMVPGETAIVPCAHAERTSMAEGTTAMGRTRMHDIDLLGATTTTTTANQRRGGEPVVVLKQLARQSLRKA